MRGSAMKTVMLCMEVPTSLAAAGGFAARYTLLGLVLAALSLGLVHAGRQAVKRARTTEAVEAKAEYDHLHGRKS